MRTIAIIEGSETDLKQSRAGLQWLLENDKDVMVLKVFIASQHRHTLRVQNILDHFAEHTTKLDALIVGAGWANHLTGCCDAYLRYKCRNLSIPVIGVAFEDVEEELHTQAAILSITQVPGTKVLFEDDDGQFVGAEGFLAACKFAAYGKFPDINLKDPPEAREFYLAEAIRRADELLAKK